MPSTCTGAAPDAGWKTVSAQRRTRRARASAAVHAAPHGLQVALAHVPSWTHAYQVLTQHLSAYTQNGGAGAAGTAGLEGVRRGLHLGLKR